MRYSQTNRDKATARVILWTPFTESPEVESYLPGIVWLADVWYRAWSLVSALCSPYLPVICSHLLDPNINDHRKQGCAVALSINQNTIAPWNEDGVPLNLCIAWLEYFNRRMMFKRCWFRIEPPLKVSSDLMLLSGRCSDLDLSKQDTWKKKLYWFLVWEVFYNIRLGTQQ